MQMCYKSMRVILGALLLVISNIIFAASMETVWHSLDKLGDLNKFYIDNSSAKNQPASVKLMQQLNPKNTEEQLKFSRATQDEFHISHARYNQYYKDLPVYDGELIFHIDPSEKNQDNTLVTGTYVKDLAKDLPSVTARLSEKDMKVTAEEIFQQQFKGGFKTKGFNIEKFVYLNKDEPKIAYTVTFYAKKDKVFMKPYYIIDANDKTVYEYWNDLRSEEVQAMGKGGNVVPTKANSDTTYEYQFGTNYTGLDSLGTFKVQRADSLKGRDICTVQDSQIQVIRLDDKTKDKNFFPVYIEEEKDHPIYSYACSAPNYAQSGDSYNGANSPINDAKYFAEKVIEMYSASSTSGGYGITDPFGKIATGYLPMRIYTHFSDENAYAMGAEKKDGKIVSYQQLAIGNGTESTGQNEGEEDSMPYSDPETIGHEMGHLFLSNHTDLSYKEQSGGLNEAFADMAGKAFSTYLNGQYAWFPNRWDIGVLISKARKASRYFDDPTKDKKSIGNAKDYKEGMDVHYSSGVYNKAFYLLSTLPGWNVQKAFDVMIAADMNYWNKNVTFNFAACGVLESIYFKSGKSCSTVNTVKKNVFAQVGVHCVHKDVCGDPT